MRLIIILSTMMVASLGAVSHHIPFFGARSAKTAEEIDAVYSVDRIRDAIDSGFVYHTILVIR